MVALRRGFAGWLVCNVVRPGLAPRLPLFSPLVDLAEAERDGTADTDRFLPPGFVTEGVRAWRGGIPAGDPRFDLLGALGAGLPPLFVGFDRDELLAPGARRLVAAARATLRAAAAMLFPAPGGRC